MMSAALRDTLIRSMAVLNPNPYVIFSHNARELCEESCGVFLNGRYSRGDRSRGLSIHNILHVSLKNEGIKA